MTDCHYLFYAGIDSDCAKEFGHEKTGCYVVATYEPLVGKGFVKFSEALAYAKSLGTEPISLSIDAHTYQVSYRLERERRNEEAANAELLPT